MNTPNYLSQVAIGVSGASGITTFCRTLPQCSMVLFDKDSSRAFFIAQNDQMPSSAEQIITNTESITNISIFVVSAKKKECDMSVQSIENYLQMSDAHIDQKVIIAVNKMDAVNYSKERFLSIKDRMTAMFKRQRGFDMDQIVAFIPVSAFKGDNMHNDKSSNMAWYDGDALGTMMHKIAPNGPNTRLLGLPIVKSAEGEKVCLVKYRTATLRTGDSVKFFPSGIESKVESIRSYEKIVDVDHGGQVIGVRINKPLVSMLPRCPIQRMALFGIATTLLYFMTKSPENMV